MEIPTMIPKSIKDLKGEELRLLSEFGKSDAYELITRLITNEIEVIKRALSEREPTADIPQHIEYFQRGKERGRIIGALIIPGIVKNADAAIAEKMKKVK